MFKLPLSAALLLLAALTVATITPVFARDYIDVRTLPNFAFGSWNLAGSLQMQQSHCIASADTRRTSGWGNKDRKVNYSIVLQSTQEASTFTLFLDGTVNSDATKRLRIRFNHEDLLAGSGSEQLQPGVRETHSHVGQWFGCPSGNNSRITAQIDAADLRSVRSGSYSGSFRLTASNPDESGSVTFSVTITVNSGGNVRISRLDTVRFGTHSGIGDITSREYFCIHSAVVGGGYKLSINPKTGSTSQFTLVASGGGDAIPLELAFSTGSTATSLSPGTSVSGIGSAQQDCSGADNAYLDFRLRERDLQAASSGRYVQTLIILVEPL